MKIILAAPATYYGQPKLGPSYEYLHFFQSLVAAGHQVNFIDSFAKKSTLALLQAATDAQADLIIIVPNQDEIEWPALPKAPCKTLAILSDDQWRRVYGLAIAPYFDYIMAQAPDSPTAYGAKYVPFEWAIYEGLYQPIHAPRSIDVAFLGQLYGDRGEFIHRLKTAGVPVMTQGWGFPEQLHSVAIPDLLKQTKIGLSFSRSSDGSCLQVKTRPFEVVAAGALLISEYAPGLENCFVPDIEAVFFTTADELIDKVKYYLAHETERAAIAQKGYERVTRDHTYTERWAALPQPVDLAETLPIKPAPPTVSVLIPAYNAELTIRRAVRSALEQRGVEVEVIVCDDGSSDRTGEYAAKAGATVFHHLHNQGVSEAQNTAACHATGQYCIVLGADDWLEPNCLALMVAELEKRQAGFVYGATKYWGKRSDLYVPEAHNPALFYQRFVSLYAVLFKREAIKEKDLRWHRFENGGPEDWDFVLQLIEAGYSGTALRSVLVLNHVNQDGTLTETATTSDAMQQLKARHPQLEVV